MFRRQDKRIHLSIDFFPSTKLNEFIFNFATMSINYIHSKINVWNNWNWIISVEIIVIFFTFSLFSNHNEYAELWKILERSICFMNIHYKFGSVKKLLCSRNVPFIFLIRNQIIYAPKKSYFFKIDTVLKLCMQAENRLIV